MTKGEEVRRDRGPWRGACVRSRPKVSNEISFWIQFAWRLLISLDERDDVDGIATGGQTSFPFLSFDGHLFWWTHENEAGARMRLLSPALASQACRLDLAN